MEKKVMSDIMFNVLSDVISAVTILEVKSEKNLEGTSIIYIKTDNLDTVDKSMIEKIANKNSVDGFEVKFLIPETKFINEVHVKNVDTVCIFIEAS